MRINAQLEDVVQALAQVNVGLQAIESAGDEYILVTCANEVVGTLTQLDDNLVEMHSTRMLRECVTCQLAEEEAA